MTAWRNKLALVLSGNTAQLIRSIPDLAQIIEAPSDVASEASDPKVLLALALQGFCAIAEPDHPLVVFLDDAQWADAESWQLVQQLTNDSDLVFLVICAYREDDAANDRLQGIFGHPSASGSIWPWRRLDLADTGRFLADALHAAPEQVREMAALMHAKPMATPFSYASFCASLHDRSLVSFDPERRAWQWNPAQIRAAPSPTTWWN
ncbi:MAG: AAA family ATPase [Kouleothrix sp.]|nr:AAA family ATPase [Kouleothrix sp.]